jgi:hypothetical protein
MRGLIPLVYRAEECILVRINDTPIAPQLSRDDTIEERFPWANESVALLHDRTTLAIR